MNSVKDMCDRAIWLKHGAIAGEGDPAELVESYTEMMLGDRTRGTDGSTRRGSGEIEIERVELFAGTSKTPVKRFRTSDDITLRLHYRTTRAVPKPVFGFEIEHLGGTTVTAPCTRDVGLLPDSVSGTGYVEIEMANVSLLPGTYDLHTSVTDFNRQHEYDRLHVALRFDVMTGKPYETGAVVTLRPRWSLQS